MKKLAAHLASNEPPVRPRQVQTEESRRARGYGKITLRVPLATLEQLKTMAEQLGHSPTRVVNSLILLADQSRPQNR